MDCDGLRIDRQDIVQVITIKDRDFTEGLSGTIDININFLIGD